jgi:putative membrane protein
MTVAREAPPMDDLTRYEVGNVALFAVAMGHAAITWPPEAIVALFGGGIVIAAVAELVGVAAGLVEHELEPQVAGVPLSILLAWPAVVYVSLQVALLAVPAGVEAAALAAVLATAADVVTDPEGVANGVWHYPESQISTPRFRGVPWWNFAGWLVIVFVTALLPTLVW